MIEAHAVLQGGRQAYFAGERICLHISFKNTHVERDETILWASAQLYCVQSLAKRYVNVDAASHAYKPSSSSQSSKLNTTSTSSITTNSHKHKLQSQTSLAIREAHMGTRLHAQTQSGAHTVALSAPYTLPQAILCCDVSLSPSSSSGTYCYVAQIPMNTCASNSGVAVRVQHRVAVSFQRMNGTTAQLIVPVRVFVLPERVREWVRQFGLSQIPSTHSHLYALNTKVYTRGGGTSPGGDKAATLVDGKEGPPTQQNGRHTSAVGEGWCSSDDERDRLETGLDMSQDDQQVWMDVIPALDMLSEHVAGIGSFDDTEGIFQKVITRAKSRLRARDLAYMQQQQQLAQQTVEDDDGVDGADSGAGAIASAEEARGYELNRDEHNLNRDGKRDCGTSTNGALAEGDGIIWKSNTALSGGARVDVAMQDSTTGQSERRTPPLTHTSTHPPPPTCTQTHLHTDTITCVSHTGDVSVGLWVEKENVRWLKHTLQRLHAYVSSERRTRRYRIGGSDSRVGVFTLFKPSYCIGEEVTGEFDFSDATLSTYMVKVSLEATELVRAPLENNGQPKPQTTHYSTQWVHTHNVLRSPLRLSVPLSVSPSYASELDTVISDNGNTITHTAPQSLDVCTFTWRLPLQVLPSNPLNFNEIKRPAVKLF
ncbi:hypothetical protein SARC_08852 [Sphaeroforma arctica JP610]|uniref:Uncharacterized protein n=1 Tax=Sphaeroforma arctica JP610 TaxID=667725 RepID=A0A0L0FPU1_9EUKA|nr:hypothetical protein SARC_08852 [Sphaeroforma arctica JP610]KNC78729.1 hypothetical protein SARC_08852 [Sphaeroforma arctica JP610]|eukprot:XP_014152631.1 hypothetical protein SARC_08852 [Sphaeroforma arctica JP610]